MSRQRTRERERHKIPDEIGFALDFIDEGLSRDQWEAEARRIIRENLPLLGQEPECCLFEEYNPEIARLIAEEQARN